jgi:hypothetical protein
MKNAIKAARSAVSMPEKCGNSYRVTGPWDSACPDGARTEKTCVYRSSALQLRARWITEIALIASGCDPEDASYRASEADLTGKKPEQIVAEFLAAVKA